MSSSRDDQQRTNSLAFAKVDCYTCSALKTPCDRQRPWCGTCISNQRKCGGFKMSLVWKDSISPTFSAETSCTSDPSTLNTSPTYQPESSHRKRQEFKFIQGRSKRKRKSKLSDQSREAYPAADNQKYFLPHMGLGTSLSSSYDFTTDTVVTRAITLPYDDQSMCNDGFSTLNENFDFHFLPQSNPLLPNESELDVSRDAHHRYSYIRSDEFQTHQPSHIGSHSGGNISNASTSRLSDIQVVSQHLPDEHTLPIPELRYQSQAHKYNAILDICEATFVVNMNNLKLPLLTYMSQIMMSFASCH